ncbi:hemolysin family protein [Phorcysia thermohydrogeniphila]|uniref:CBS domain containing-hemolysin-like protein n=1 Tax=Phorcysia thermohydrogeniphila TaxID=936138 RepID=A0A4R1G6S6_9BACT|nr:hemolysin family protein [Phorcysia thermohydrogeniphila]TCK03424.1 CBS domain containing-hemolysin-like protein [Phorcysia thermohydrogeniphila]
MESGSLTVYYFILPALVLLSGLFSASETAFFSLNTLRLERLAKEGNKKAAEALKLLQNPANLIATILIGNEMVNVAIAATSTMLFVKLLGEEEGATLAVPATVITLLIFGEVTPKTLAIKYSEKYAFFILNFIKAVGAVITPLRFLLVGVATILLKPFGVELFNKPKAITDEEFMILVSEGAKEGTIAQEEKELIDRTLDLGEMDVKEIMTPRHKIFALREELTVQEAIEKIKDKKFSRIPVYKDSLDQITGILYTRKILPLKLEPRELKKPIKEFMDEPYFVTEFLTLDRLLEDMQRTKKHMAIVVDEYGNTAGLVTLDDILNEIVGESPEESKELSEDRLRLAGDTPIDEVKELLHLREDEILSEVDTLAGLLMALTERIPKKGESVGYQGYTFTVEETEGNRITSVIVEKRK